MIETGHPQVTNEAAVRQTLDPHRCLSAQAWTNDPVPPHPVRRADRPWGRRLLGIVLAAALAACGGGGGAGGAGDGAGVPIGQPSPTTGAAAAIDARLEQAVTEGRLTGLTLRVMNRNDQVVYNRRFGTLTEDQRLTVAGASQLASALVALRLIEQGQLSLDSTTGQMLGWTGPKADISVRHLLSQTSGLAPQAPCVTDASVTLRACATSIGAAPTLAAPGARFDEGAAGFQVLGAIAEAATAKSWNTVFQEALGAPLTLSAQARYHTAPRAESGGTNPSIGGGLRISTADYFQLLRLAFHKGTVGGRSLIAASRIDQQGVEPYPAVVLGTSPARDLGLAWRYGLGVWLECATPASGCSAQSAPGGLGFTPWFDRNLGYYAVLAMESGDTEAGFHPFAVRLAQDLKPLIARALP